VSKVDYRVGAPVRGDIVVFQPTTDSTIPYVKRVAAVAGDTVDLRDGVQVARLVGTSWSDTDVNEGSIKVTGVAREEPIHDRYSHAADALRQLAQAIDGGMVEGGSSVTGIESHDSSKPRQAIMGMRM